MTKAKYVPLKNFAGTKLKELRKERKLTLRQLAEKLDVSPQAVNLWEQGNSLPDVNRLADIANVFLVPVNYFYEVKE